MGYLDALGNFLSGIELGLGLLCLGAGMVTSLPLVGNLFTRIFTLTLRALFDLV